jgi:hypothetical protein
MAFSKLRSFYSLAVLSVYYKACSFAPVLAYRNCSMRPIHRSFVVGCATRCTAYASYDVTSANHSLQPGADIHSAHCSESNVRMPELLDSQMVMSVMSKMFVLINDIQAKMRSMMIIIEMSVVQRGPK